MKSNRLLSLHSSNQFYQKQPLKTFSVYLYTVFLSCYSQASHRYCLPTSHCGKWGVYFIPPLCPFHNVMVLFQSTSSVILLFPKKKNYFKCHFLFSQAQKIFLMNIFHKMRTLFILHFSNRVFTLFYLPVSFSCAFIFRCSRLITLTQYNNNIVVFIELYKCLSAEKHQVVYFSRSFK